MFFGIDRKNGMDYIKFMSKSRETILAKIRRKRKSFLYGTLIAGASAGGFKGCEMLRFELAATEILRCEGGYADDKKPTRKPNTALPI